MSYLQPNSPFELKIKLKSLMSEVQIVRLEKKRRKARARQLKELGAKKGFDPASAVEAHLNVLNRAHVHMKNVVCRQLRSTHLARAFLKGLPLGAVEPFAYTEPDWAAVEAMVKRYSLEDPRFLNQRLAAWKDERIIMPPRPILKQDFAPRHSMGPWKNGWRKCLGCGGGQNTAVDKDPLDGNVVTIETAKVLLAPCLHPLPKKPRRNVTGGPEPEVKAAQAANELAAQEELETAAKVPRHE